MASFDENGKYIKTDWKAGDKITATKLNKIEESIEAVNDNDISRHVEADARLDALEAKDATQDKELTNIKNTIADNKAASELGDYDINSRMTFLEEELNEGIEEVHNIQEEMTTQINNAKDEMNTQVNNAKEELNEGLEEIATQVNNAKADMTTQVNNAKEELNEGLEEIATQVNNAKEEMTTQINNAKEEMTTQINNAKADMTTQVNNAKEDMNTQVNNAKDEMNAVVDEANERLSTKIDLYASNIVTPQMFGAKADGVTDDSQAILDAIAALPKDGGTLYFPAGTYIHGDGGTTGLSYQIDPDRSTDDTLVPLMQNKGVDDRIGRDIRLIFNGYKNLKIIGNGAVLQSHENNGECSNNKFFTFKNCENVLVENITIDGKREERDIKLNDYSPGGYDLTRSNLDFKGCKRIIIRNVVSKNSMMDGMSLGSGSATVYNEDVLIEQCVFNNNHRQGISIEGATNVVVRDTECSYNGTGKGILPKSGIDVEAYGYVGPGEQYSYNNNILIDNCYFDSNGGSSVISNQNSFNVTFQNCVMKNAGVNATPVTDAQVLYCRLENCSIVNSFKRIAYNIFTYNKGGYVIQSLAVSGTSTAIIEHNTFDMTPTSETFKSYKYNSMRLEENETFRYNHIINACAVKGGGYYPIFFTCKNFIGNILELTNTSFEGTEVATNPHVSSQQSKGGKAKDNICIGYVMESATNMNADEFTTSLKTNYDKAYTHSSSAHAPSNAQKNSDITKAEIEAKLTGEIVSHSHSRTDENWGAENVGMVLMVGSDGRLVLYDLADYNPNAQFFNVIQNYTNVSSDYSKTQAKESFPITITLVTTNGKKLDEVKVIMGGKDVTSTVYSDGKIVITSVTGEIVITADAMLYTNLFDHTHPDVITGKRWNKAGTVLNNYEYGIITHDIPFSKGDTVRIKGLNQVGANVGSGIGGTVILEIKDEAGTRVYLQCLDTVNNNGFFKSGSYSVDNANNLATFTFTNTRNGIIKISGERVVELDEVVITINEEIID